MPPAASSPDPYRPWLVRWRLRDQPRGRQNLQFLESNITGTPFPAFLEALSAYLPASADPDMALNNLERFFAGGSAIALPRLLDPGSGLFDVLLQLFAASQYLS